MYVNVWNINISHTNGITINNVSPSHNVNALRHNCRWPHNKYACVLLYTTLVWNTLYVWTHSGRWHRRKFYSGFLSKSKRSIHRQSSMFIIHQNEQPSSSSSCSTINVECNIIFCFTILSQSANQACMLQ